jgi:hypothetical protein
MLNNKRKNLGYFDNIEDAQSARQAAEIKYFGKYRHAPIDLCPLFFGLCPECEARLMEILNNILPPEPDFDWE